MRTLPLRMLDKKSTPATIVNRVKKPRHIHAGAERILLTFMSERKSYTTKTRQEILACLKQNHTSTVSVTDISDYLKAKGISANPTTIYRYLDKLCAEQIAIKYPDIESDKAVYQYAGEEHSCTDHLHLKCIRCGRVFHLDCSFMDELKEHLLSEHGFRLQCSGDLLHGICQDCEEKEN